MIISLRPLVRAYGYAVPCVWARAALVVCLVAPGAVVGQSTRQGIPQPTVITITDDVPPGFESLMEPRSVLVDVYFNERKRGVFEAETDGEVLRFLEPDTVVEALGAVEDVETVSALLGQSLPAHPEKVCFRPDDPIGCGYLEPTPIGLIYDEAQLRVDVFLDSALQIVQSAGSARHLPSPETGFSSLMGLRAVATDTGTDDPRFNLGARLVAGRKATHFRSAVDYRSEGSRAQLDELALTHHYSDLELLAGSYRIDLGGGLTGMDLLGFSLGSSTKTRVDLDNAFSTELIVYLPRRSVVQLVVDERVYSGQRYDAGNQSIDTTSLPSGTYDLEIRINDPVTGMRSEFQVYTKTNEIPPRGESVIEAHLGVPLDHVEDNFLPDTSRSAVAALSYASRLTDRSAFRLGVLQIGGQQLLQGDYTWLGRRLSLQARSSAGTGKTLALSSRASFRYRRLSASIDARWFHTNLDRSEDRFLSGVFSENTRQLSVSLGQSFGSTRTQQNSEKMEEFSHSISLSRQSEEDSVWSTDTRAQLFSNASGESVGLSFDAFNDSVDASVSSEWESTDSGIQNGSTVASLRAAIGAHQDGIAVSGGSLRDAGVLLDLRGDPSAGRVDVYVNDSRVTTARIGTRTLVGLSPYREYSVSLVPNALLVLDGDALEVGFTLHPGNLQRIMVNAYREVLLIAILEDEFGQALSNASVGSDELATTTDEGGVVQIAGRPGSVISVASQAGDHCLITIPEPVSDDYVQVPADPLRCMPDPRTQ